MRDWRRQEDLWRQGSGLGGGDEGGAPLPRPFDDGRRWDDGHRRAERCGSCVWLAGPVLGDGPIQGGWVRRGVEVSALEAYVAAWVANDPRQIADAVTDDAVIAECYGPVYRGRACVLRWAEQWFAEGGIVHRWEVDDLFRAGDREAASWTFECTWRGARHRFSGSTLARTREGLIREAREYRTTADPYDWQGTWL